MKRSICLATSCACAIEEMTAMPDTPARHTISALPGSMPPMPMTGTCGYWVSL
nr:hypothetical protein [Planococcus sp. MB-3u-03]